MLWLFCSVHLLEGKHVPPICTLDAPVVGVAIILEYSFDDDTCRIIVPVHTNLGMINDKTLRDIQMATYDFDVPPTVGHGDEEGVLLFEFDPDTVEETIPVMLGLIFEEYAKRVERHLKFQQSGPSIATYSELKFHG